MSWLRFLVFIILFTVAELLLLWSVARQIGWDKVLIALAGSATAGAILILIQIKDAARNSLRLLTATPSKAIMDKLLIGLAAVFLVIPGFLSDVLAIFILLPWGRRVVYLLARNWLVAKARRLHLRRH